MKSLAELLVLLAPTTALAADTSPPQVIHTPCSSYTRGEPHRLNAEIWDESTLFAPRAVYRLEGERSWREAPLTPEGSGFAALLRGDGAALEYFLEVFDSEGNGPGRSGSPEAPHRVVAATAGACVEPATAPAQPGRPGTTGLVLRSEPGAAFLFGERQTERYQRIGGGATIKVGLGGDPLGTAGVRWVVGQLEAGYLGFPQKETVAGGGMTLFTGGLRVSPPSGFQPGLLPYADVHAGVTRTGVLTRFVVDGSIGLDIDVAGMRLGPFAKYLRIVDHERPGVTPGDASLLQIGLAAGIDTGDGPPGLVGEIAPGQDRDRDGVPDRGDACPDVPESIDGIDDWDGCPETDRDGDGLKDGLDRCPDAAEDKDGYDDADGCPDPDDDGDGVPDTEDRCPREPGPAVNRGCPDRDGDGDGLIDRLDSCPLEPGPEAAGGCPQRDRDGDTLLDEVDQCPDVPGAAPSGCPKRILVTKTATQIEIKEQINFATNKATIVGKLSVEILDQVAAVLRSNPEISVAIEGHTDDVADDDYNLKLSDARAKAVREALMARGIDGGRMEATGFGESRPLAPNTSRRGRALNRRVEFNIRQAPPAPPP